MKRQIGVIAIAIVALVIGGACGLAIGGACGFKSEPLPRFSVSEIENPDLQFWNTVGYGNYEAWQFRDNENRILVQVLRPVVGGYDFRRDHQPIYEDVFTPLELPTSDRSHGVVGEISEGENYGLAATIGIPRSSLGGFYFGLWERVRSDFLLHKHFRLDVQFDGDDPETGNFMERLHEEVNNIIAIAQMSMELEEAADPNAMSKKSP